MKILSHTQAHRADAEMFKALSDPSRIRILYLLKAHGGTITVNDIVMELGLEQPTVSHHLMVLYRAGLVDYERNKLNRYYHLRPDRFKEARRLLGQFTRDMFAVR